MGVTKEQLAAILQGKAKKLCSVEGDKKINEFASTNKSNLNDPSPSMYDGDADAMDRLYLSENAYNDTKMAKSNLPDSIKKSFMTKKIDVGDGTINGGSILDTMNIEKSQVRETVNRPIQSVASTSPNIDYSIIKAIVNESLREFFKDKEALNESSTLKAIRLKEGKIRIIDNRGNIFSANLERTGNINEKK